MKSMNKTVKSIFYILLIILSAEILFFNFPFWESLTYVRSDNYTTVTRNMFDRSIIEIDNTDFQINNIFLTIDDYPDDRPIPLRITFSDDANLDLGLAKTEVIKSIPESKYIKLNPDGKISNLKIEIENDIYKFDPETVKFDLNKIRPFNFNVLRVCLLLSVSLILYFLFPSSCLFKRKMFDPAKRINKENRYIVLLSALVLSAVWTCTVLTFSDDGSAGIINAYKSGSVEAIYSFQSDAFLDGHAYLNIDPPVFLSNMDDPYNPSARDELSKVTGEYAKLDFAYYKGKYYCYYGVVPTLLYYLPAKLITGLPAKNSHFILLTGIVFILASLKLIISLLKRLGNNISVGSYITLCNAFIFGSVSFCCAYNTGVYTVPNISALAFVTCGLVSWLEATEKIYTTGKISRILLILGSICMILAVGCRPTYGVFVLSAFPIFEREIKNKIFFSKKGLANTIYVIAPVLIIGTALLYYNHVRFGSPFDFGSEYNMSEVNLNGRQWGIRVLGTGLFEYLFQPLYIKADFPFFYSIYDLGSQSKDYMGYMFFSPTFGGYIFLAPISMFLLFFRKRKRTLKEKNIYSLVLYLMAAAAIMMIVDIEMAGIALRYQLDFSVLLVLATIIVICDISDDPRIIKNTALSEVVTYSVFVLTLITVMANLGIMISDNQFYPLKYLSPESYYFLKYLVFFPR